MYTKLRKHTHTHTFPGNIATVASERITSHKDNLLFSTDVPVTCLIKNVNYANGYKKHICGEDHND